MEPVAKKAKTARFNTFIPPELLTPSEVSTRLGNFTFFDGVPNAESADRLFECMDLVRGIDCFLDLVPMASIEALRAGHLSMGVTECNHGIIWDKLLDSNPLLLTGNTDTVYAMLFVDLQRDGPVVLDVPSGCGPGLIDDAFFRFVADVGPAGFDRGQGGKYLLLPPEYAELNPPEGGEEAEVCGTKYFVSKSTSYVNWVVIRGFLDKDGSPDAAATMFRERLKVYPLSAATSPPQMQWKSGSTVPVNTIHANNFKFYEEIHTVLQKEPLGFLEPELRGKAASIGLQKGKPFQPSDQLRATLTEAVSIANAMARAVSFRYRDEEVYWYGKSANWFTPFVGGDYKWLREKGKGGRNQDARLMFFYMATGNTPAMAMKMVGKGSQYAVCTLDEQHNTLDGAATYTLTLPKDVPAKDFWSVVLYDPQTRSELQTGSPFPSKNNVRDKATMKYNDDGSITLLFGPKPPEGETGNFIQTVPGKAWFAIVRLYGPLDAWFDQTWRPGQFIKQPPSGA